MLRFMQKILMLLMSAEYFGISGHSLSVQEPLTNTDNTRMRDCTLSVQELLTSTGDARSVNQRQRNTTMSDHAGIHAVSGRERNLNLSLKGQMVTYTM